MNRSVLLPCALVLSSAAALGAPSVSTPKVAEPGPVTPKVAARASVVAKKGDDGPPGLVKIKGGRTYVGSTSDDIEKLLEEDDKLLRVFDAERPQNRERVEDFYYMVTEVTNEQYKAFVDATGYRSPRGWADKVIAEASRAFLEAEGKARQEAREAGKPYDRKKFDPDVWWKNNFETAKVEMPVEEALLPVGYISYEDALAYCAWAGLRLPSEAEFQRAVRGDSKNAYPWGEEWDGSRAATSEMRNIKKGLPVGKLKEGVSEDGLFDLLGNVWEWTTSPYEPYKGFKPEKYEIGKGKDKKKYEVEFHKWDANQRVAVGGSFQTPRIAARATTRRETERNQRTNALGFRAAASPTVGVDIANSTYEYQIRNSDARGQGVEFVAETAVVIDRWETRDTLGKAAPEGYQVIDRYDYLMWLPLEKLEQANMPAIEKASRVAPVTIGVYSTSIATEVPALPAGTYFVSYRGKGKAIEAKEEDGDKAGMRVQEPAAGMEEVDTKEETFLFTDAVTGEVVATIEVNITQNLGVRTPPKVDKSKNPGKLSLKDEKVWTKDAAGEDVQIVEKHLVIDANVPASVAKRSLLFTMQLKIDQEAAKKDWRGL